MYILLIIYYDDKKWHQISFIFHYNLLKKKLSPLKVHLYVDEK